MTEHLGYEKHDPAGAGTGNVRSGIRSKTVLTEQWACRDRGAAGSGQQLRAAARQEAATPAQRCGADRALPLRQGPDHWGDLRAIAEIYDASVSKKTIP